MYKWVLLVVGVVVLMFVAVAIAGFYFFTNTQTQIAKRVQGDGITASFTKDDKGDVRKLVVDPREQWPDANLYALPGELSKLKKVRSLTLYNSQADDLEQLGSMKELHELVLFDCAIKDFSAIGDLPICQQLNVSFHNRPASEFGSLVPVPGVRLLELNGHDGEVPQARGAIYDAKVNASRLANFSDLQELTTNNLTLTGFRPLSRLRNLKTLAMYGYETTDFSGLNGIAALDQLVLGPADPATTPTGLDGLSVNELVILGYQDMAPFGKVKATEMIVYGVTGKPKNVEALADIPGIRRLIFQYVDISRREIADLKKRMPNCSIDKYD